MTLRLLLNGIKTGLCVCDCDCVWYALNPQYCDPTGCRKQTRKGRAVMTFRVRVVTIQRCSWLLAAVAAFSLFSLHACNNRVRDEAARNIKKGCWWSSSSHWNLTKELEGAWKSTRVCLNFFSPLIHKIHEGDSSLSLSLSARSSVYCSRKRKVASSHHIHFSGEKKKKKKRGAHHHAWLALLLHTIRRVVDHLRWDFFLFHVTSTAALFFSLSFSPLSFV